MFELLPEMPLAAKFFVAFLIVLALIGLTAWLVRRFGQNRLGGGAARGRQPRLAVIDAASVDGRRRLVLIRRDNIEHLLMIGGPTDVVVEQNIVRAASATSRDAGREPVRANAPGETLPRAVPLGDTGSWPLQPTVETPPAPPPPATPPIRATRSAPADDQWTAPEPIVPRARTLPEFDIPPATPPEPARDIAPEPPRAPPPPMAEPAAAPQTDRNLAEMAQRLEAALRRPGVTETPRAADPMSVPMPPPPRASDAPRAAPRDSTVRPEPKAAPAKSSSTSSSFESLEQEMANLLGRPPGKT